VRSTRRTLNFTNRTKIEANHIQVAYANDAKAADECLLSKAHFASALGMKVNLCGTRSRTLAWR
jgi:hypothetical protein